MNKVEQINSPFSSTMQWDEVGIMYMWWKHCGQSDNILPSELSVNLKVSAIAELLKTGYEIVSVSASCALETKEGARLPTSKDDFIELLEFYSSLKDEIATKDNDSVSPDDEDEDDEGELGDLDVSGASFPHFWESYKRDNEVTLFLKKDNVIARAYFVVKNPKTGLTFVSTDREGVSKLISGLVSRHTPVKQAKASKFFIAIEARGSIGLREFRLSPIDVDLDLFYGPKFKASHDKILYGLKNRKDGLYLFHGPPGTGKTSYIKHLAYLMSGEEKVQRDFIFIPTTMVENLTNPSFLNVLLSAPNSVLVLEDAEKAVISREDNGYADLVSTLLNLADGILGSILNIAIIVSFNTQRSQIDKALLRRGRLVCEHKFDLLPPETCIRVAEKLGIKDYKTTEPQALSEIFNFKYNTGHEEEAKKSIGFAP